MKRKKNLIARRVILGILTVLIIAGGVYCQFGGFGTGKSADTAEFQQLKLDVFQVMVEKYGVRAFALEADYGCCETANRYIHGGEGTASRNHKRGESEPSCKGRDKSNTGCAFCLYSASEYRTWNSNANGERTTFAVYSYNPLAKAAKKSGYDIC